MSFHIDGRPFGGIYPLSLDFESMIGDDLNKEVASMVGSFEMNHNIDDIEKQLNEAIITWTRKGLNYI